MDDEVNQNFASNPSSDSTQFLSQPRPRRTKRFAVAGWLYAIIVFAGIGGYYSWKYFVSRPDASVINTSIRSEGEDKDLPVIIQINNNTIPALIPKDFPLEQGAEVVENYGANTLEYETHVRMFYSKNTVQKNLELYKKYFDGRKWETSATKENGMTILTIEQIDGVGKITLYDADSKGRFLVKIAIMMKKSIKNP